jgi:hypothetical protein
VLLSGGARPPLAPALIQHVSIQQAVLPCLNVRPPPPPSASASASHH